MVVGRDFQPVVHAAHHDLAGEDVGHHAVLEDNMHLAVVLDILVVGPQQSGVPIGVQPGDLMDPGADRAGTQRSAQPGQAFLPLEVERCRQGVATLAHNGASSRPGPVPVSF